MTDERLRELERLCKQSDSQEHQVEWLVERLRQGDLAPERLELAVLLKDPVARLAWNHAPDVWIGSSKLIAIAGATSATVSRWRKQGVPFEGRGKSIRYRLPQVLAWLEDHASDHQVVTVYRLLGNATELYTPEAAIQVLGTGLRLLHNQSRGLPQGLGERFEYLDSEINKPAADRDQGFLEALADEEPSGRAGDLARWLGMRRLLKLMQGETPREPRTGKSLETIFANFLKEPGRGSREDYTQRFEAGLAAGVVPWLLGSP